MVARVVEESAFRGYMQGPIERRFGPLLAIGASGPAFAALHFTHDEMALVLVPMFFVASAIFGILDYLTGSILPGAVIHATVDAIGFLIAWWRGPQAAEPLV